MDTTQSWDEAQPADMSTDSSVLTMACDRVRASARNRARHVWLKPPPQFTYIPLSLILFPLLANLIKFSLFVSQSASGPSLAAKKLFDAIP